MIVETYKFDIPIHFDGQSLSRNYYTRMPVPVRLEFNRKFFRHLDTIVPKMKLYTIKTEYTFHGVSGKKNDKNNVCAVVDKILMDYLVSRKMLIDDNNSFVKNTEFKLGSVDKKNPRVFVKIHANKIPKHMKGTL